MKILIVLTGSIGDVVRATAIPALIKTYDPKAEVTWFVETLSAPIVSLSKAVDKLIVYQRKGGLLAFYRAIGELRKERYDLVLDMQRIFKSGVVSFLSRAKRRVTFNRKNSKEFNWLFATEELEYRDEDRESKFAIYLSFVSRLFGEATAERIREQNLPQLERDNFGLRIPDLSLEIKKQLGSNAEEKRVAFVLGSSWVSKNWPALGYRRLASLILEQTSAQILLIGDQKQQAEAEELALLNPRRIISLVGKTKLEELLPLAQLSALGVGPDSGPMHIFSLLGIPYVSLFGPTSATRVAPYKNLENVIRYDIACAPCYRRRCPGLGNICMRLISPERVFASIQHLL